MFLHKQPAPPFNLSLQKKVNYFFCSAMGQSTGGLSQQGLSHRETFLQQGLSQSENRSLHPGLS